VMLSGADGVVFVADSSAQQLVANRASWNNLQANLKTLGLERIPIVVQYNKRDLADAVSLDTVDRFGDPNRKLAQACAKSGDGVVPTFFELVERAWEALDKDLQLVEKLGIDSTAFRAALAEHVGVATKVS
jgi:mutual gliding-motility protein MglA